VRGTISNARPYRNTRTLTSLIPARWAGSTPARSITAIFGRASSGSWNVFASIFTLPTCSGNPTNFQSEPPPATFLCNWFWRGGSPARNRRQQIRTRTRYSARMDIGKIASFRTKISRYDAVTGSCEPWFESQPAPPWHYIDAPGVAGVSYGRQQYSSAILATTVAPQRAWTCGRLGRVFTPSIYKEADG